MKQNAIFWNCAKYLTNILSERAVNKYRELFFVRFFRNSQYVFNQSIHFRQNNNTNKKITKVNIEKQQTGMKVQVYCERFLLRCAAKI